MRFRFRTPTHQDPDLRDALVQVSTGLDRTGYDQLYALVRDYYAGVLFTGYAAGGVRLTARRLRTRWLRRALLEPAILDAPIDAREPGTTWRDRLAAPVDLMLPLERCLSDVPADPDVVWAVNQLTARQRQVVFLVVCGQAPEAEVGALLGTSQQNISKTKQRALRRLQVLLEGRGHRVA